MDLIRSFKKTSLLLQTLVRPPTQIVVLLASFQWGEEVVGESGKDSVSPLSLVTTLKVGTVKWEELVTRYCPI